MKTPKTYYGFKIPKLNGKTQLWVRRYYNKKRFICKSRLIMIEISGYAYWIANTELGGLGGVNKCCWCDDTINQLDAIKAMIRYTREERGNIRYKKVSLEFLGYL